MTRDETQKIMQMLAVAYPNFYKDKSKDFRNSALDVWAIALSDYRFSFIAAGIKDLLQTKIYPPVPAEVIQAAKDTARSAQDYLLTAPEKTLLEFKSGKAAAPDERLISKEAKF